MDIINFIYDIISSPISWLAGMLFLFGYTWTPKTETDEVVEEHINELQDKKVDKDADKIGAGGVINPFETVDIKGGIHLYDRDPQAIVTFSIDDGHARYDWPDLFDSKGITGTAFPAHHHMGDTGPWLALQADGWEIGNHTKTHPHLDELTEQQIEDEVGDAKAVAENWGFTIRNFAYPYGDYNDLVRKIVRKYHLGAATIKERLNMPPFGMDILHRVNGDADTLEQLKDRVDDVVNSASWMIVTLHEADAPKLTKIGDLIDYIQGKNIQILTMSEAEDLIGNLVSSRYFNVGAKGEVSASLPPSPNLLDNSQFGVWSQSDAAKGLATINYITGDKGGGSAPSVGDAVVGDTSGAVGKIISYTIGGGTWNGGNAEGALTLGAVTGTFQDGETVTFEADQETCIVDGDKSIGILNDPMNNDDKGDWLLNDCTLAFDTDHYEITRTAATQRVYQQNITLKKGKMYRIEFDYKDGTEAGVAIYAWFFDDGGNMGRFETTGAEWASYSDTFECGADVVTGQLGIMCNLAGAANVEVKNFSCYEITPCCTGDDGKAFDGWSKAGGLDIYREHNNEEATTKRGSFYALKYVSSGTGFRLSFPHASDREEWYKQFRGRIVTFGMWVLTNTASHAVLRIYDGVGYYSKTHTGGGNWEWLEVTVTVSTANTNLLFSLLGGIAPNVDGSTIIHISQPKIMFGSSMGGGNYAPKQGEWVRCEKAISLSTLHNKESFSDVAWADLNIKAESEGMIPKGAKALLIGASVNDDGSAGGDCYLVFRKDDVLGEQLYFSPYGLANDAVHRGEGIINLDISGDLDYKIMATNGAFDIPRLKVYAVLVN